MERVEIHQISADDLEAMVNRATRREADRIIAAITQSKEPPALLSVKQISELASISRSTVRLWMRQGKIIPVLRDRNTVRFDRTAIMEFLNNR